MVSQIEACSAGSLQIEPRAVYEVIVPGQASDFGSPALLRNRALELLAQQKGVASAQELADHVMVILPPNDFAGFVGNAGVNHWVSTLNDLWALDVMVYMVSGECAVERRGLWCDYKHGFISHFTFPPTARVWTQPWIKSCIADGWIGRLQ